MNVNPISQNNPSFGYKSPLKTLFIKGKFPSVKYGFYGDVLTKQNVSLEHLKPHSKGGASNMTNYALASKRMNNARGNDNIKGYADIDNIVRYINQFVHIQLPDFDGKKYVQGILKTLEKLGVLQVLK